LIFSLLGSANWLNFEDDKCSSVARGAFIWAASGAQAALHFAGKRLVEQTQSSKVSHKREAQYISQMLQPDAWPRDFLPHDRS
jgi:hypothetical protein